MSMAKCENAIQVSVMEEILERDIGTTKILVAEALSTMDAGPPKEGQGVPCCDKIDALVQTVDGINLELRRLLEILAKI